MVAPKLMHFFVRYRLLSVCSWESLFLKKTHEVWWTPEGPLPSWSNCFLCFVSFSRKNIFLSSIHSSMKILHGKELPAHLLLRQDFEQTWSSSNPPVINGSEPPKKWAAESLFASSSFQVKLQPIVFWDDGSLSHNPKWMGICWESAQLVCLSFAEAMPHNIVQKHERLWESFWRKGPTVTEWRMNEQNRVECFKWWCVRFLSIMF